MESSSENNNLTQKESVDNEEVDEDDEFGDFEKATTSAVSNTDSNPDLNNISNFSLLDLNETKFDELIDLISDKELWELNADKNKQILDIYHNISENYDIFKDMELCISDNNESNYDLFFSLSLKLWSKLSCIEDSSVINLFWHKSLLWKKFLETLNLDEFTITNQKMQNTLIQDSPETKNYNSESNVINNENKTNNSFEMVDSLSVPPVTFDWRLSGLLNPLTGSSISTMSAVLECDFFNDNGTKTLKFGKSLLEKELETLGLNETKKENIKKINNCDQNFNITDSFNSVYKNGKDDENYVNSYSSIYQEKFMDVDELSAEARNIHDKLPDYSYMLSTTLLFPK